MSVEFFQREVWAEEVQMGTELHGQLVPHCTRKYEGDCEYAKTVRILSVGEPLIDGYHGKVEYEDMDDDKQNLDIDIAEKFSFQVKDIDKAQSMKGLPEKYQEKAQKRLAQRRDINIGRLVAGKCLSTKAEKEATYEITKDTKPILYKDYYTEGTDANGEKVYKRVKKVDASKLSTYYEITSGEYKEGAKNQTTATGKTQTAIKTAIDTALTNLRLRNVEEGGYFEIDPTTYNLFKNNLVELSTNNPEMIRRGVVGTYDNFEFTRTNAIHNDGTHYHCFAHSGEAIAFAGQINEVEALRLQDAFADGIRGLDTYGMKIIAQDELEAVLIPVA